MPLPELLVRSFHADGQWYRHWTAQVLFSGPAGIVTLGELGCSITDVRGNWVEQQRIRAYYWFDRPYNLLEVFTPAGELDELYVHIASPARLHGTELHYTDHELDVVLPAVGQAQVIDEDEFEAATVAYGYTPAFQEACRDACARALRLVQRWSVGAPYAQALAISDTAHI